MAEGVRRRGNGVGGKADRYGRGAMAGEVGRGGRAGGACHALTNNLIKTLKIYIYFFLYILSKLDNLIACLINFKYLNNYINLIQCVNKSKSP